MSAAQARGRFVGGPGSSPPAPPRRRFEIPLADHPLFQVPALDFRGTPAGIDTTLVARTGILPQINTGMAGKVAGTRQGGARLGTPPAPSFPAARRAPPPAAAPAPPCVGPPAFPPPRGREKGSR